MKKKYLYLIIIVILVLVFLGIYLIINNNQVNSSDDKKMLIVYYSATGNTKDVADRIASNLNADLFEITPKNVYTSDDLDWTNSDSRVSKEHDDEKLRDIELVTSTVKDWSKYDTVIIGYPIWWGEAAWPVNNFIKNNNFNHKDIYTFCTSESSSVGETFTLLQEMAQSGNWVAGIRFSEEPSDAEITVFTDSILNIIA